MCVCVMSECWNSLGYGVQEGGMCIHRVMLPLGMCNKTDGTV